MFFVESAFATGKDLKPQAKPPIWNISKDGTNKSLKGKKHKPNSRFAIYDSGTSYDETDDLVWDGATGLVWERSPSLTREDWIGASGACYSTKIGGVFGWCLPAVTELATLLDDTQPDSLPVRHPFLNVQASRYHTKTTADFNTPSKN